MYEWITKFEEKVIEDAFGDCDFNFFPAFISLNEFKPLMAPVGFEWKSRKWSSID